MRTRVLIAAAIAHGMLFSMSGCQTHNYTHRGAALGGVTGGGVGAILGEAAADEPLAGAVVGSAVGAMMGASVGGALDEIDARGQERVGRALYAQEAGTTSLSEIVAMSQAGLSDDIIKRHIRTLGFSESLSAQDLIQLRDQDVGDEVIVALQDAAANQSRVARAIANVPTGPPVIVEEHVYAPHLPVRPHWRYRHHRPHRYDLPHNRVHWGFTFGH